MSRNRQLVRVLNLLALIGTKRRTLDELAEELARLDAHDPARSRGDSGGVFAGDGRAGD